jgi:hypothetical protein
LLRSCLLFFLATAFTNNLFAQNFPFREYSVVDGLPQSQAAKLVQDGRGFIWIVTRNGISRFDGIDFINYFRKNGLPSNSVHDILEDTSGVIWALSKGGMSRYTGNGFVNFPLPDTLSKFFPTERIVRDNDNNFFILWNGPEFEKNRIILFKDGEYIDYSKKYHALDTMHIQYLNYDMASGRILIGDRNKNLWIWNESLSELKKSGKFNNIYTEGVNFRGYLNDTLYHFNQGKIEAYDYRSVSGRTSVKYNMVEMSRELNFYRDNTNFKTVLPFNFTGYYFDKEDVMWLTSEGDLYRLLSTAFTSYSEQDIGKPNNWAITEDRNGHIWFGSLYNTLVEFDGKEFRERTDWKHLFKKEISFFKGSRLMSNGDTWISTSDGVLIWNGSSFSLLKGLPDFIQIVYIYEDTANKIIMLGTQLGLYVIKNGIIDLLPRFNDNDLGVIEGVTKDEDGKYWLSGHKGVIIYDFITILPVYDSVLPQALTYTIEKDSYGGIWVTSEEGLFFRGKDSPDFVHGLPEVINSSANSIIIMDNAHILIGRVSDICIIDLKKFYGKEKNYFRIYDRNDGFEGKDCLDNGIVKDKEGKFWILTSDNVVIFDPGKLVLNKNPPEIRLTGFSYQTDSLTWEPIDKSNFYYNIPDDIKLNRHQNKVQITFSGLSFTNPENVKLQYRLVGFDNQWSPPLSKRFVIYEKLPPGHYSFEVKGTNADGIETSEPFRMAFRIVPAFWQTNIFLISSVILIIALSVIITLNVMKRRMHKQKEEERLRAELSRLQMGSVLKQFDPHFSFNVISSVGSLIMKGEKEIAYDYIIKLSALLRTLLSDGSMMFRSLSDEIDFVRKYCDLQKLRFKDRFNFNIVVDENVDLQREIPKMILQTFVENAIKHGFENRIEGGKVGIEIHKILNCTEISITDNGIGRDAALKNNSIGTGQGMKIISGIFGVMNVYNVNKSTVEISDLGVSKASSGTKVKIIIPDDYRFEFGHNEK